MLDHQPLNLAILPKQNRQLAFEFPFVFLSDLIATLLLRLVMKILDVEGLERNSRSEDLLILVYY